MLVLNFAYKACVYALEAQGLETVAVELPFPLDDDAAVANLCANLDVEVGDASRVVSARGEPYSIVHQYDRYDGVVRAVNGRWPFAAS